MSQSVHAIYKNIIEQVLIIEKCKKDISKHLLMTKGRVTKTNLVYNFLSFDLDKHKLLEYAALVAVSNDEKSIINNLQKFYSYADGEELIEKIRTEILYIVNYMEILYQEIKTPGSSSFYERRMVQEISKYVIAMARLYNKRVDIKK